MKDTYLKFLHTPIRAMSDIVTTSETKSVSAPTIGQNRSANARPIHNPLRWWQVFSLSCMIWATAPQTIQAQDTEAAPVIKTNKAKATSANTPSEELPKRELSKELMFKILSSDIAIQRGEWGSAYITLFNAAKETGDPRLAKKAAEVAMGAQQMTDALDAVKLWRQLSPQSFEASQYYLSLMVIKSDYQEVAQFFIEQIKHSKAEDVSPLLYQAQSLLGRMQDKSRAFSSLESIVASCTESVDTHVVLARAAYAKGDKTRSTEEARKALGLQADSELALLTLAQALDKDSAYQVARDFIQRYPQSIEVHLAYATMLTENRELEAARKEFLSILGKFEANKKPLARLLLTLGSIELELNHSDTATTYLLRYLKEADADENKNNAYINLAQAELQRKNIKAADAWLAKVENEGSKNSIWFNVQMRRALLMASDQRFGEARQFLQTIKPNSDNEEASILQTEAQVMKAAGQQLEAFVVLEAALGNYPRHADLLYDYAMLAENLKRFDEMEGALKQLIAVAPNNAFAYNALGYSYADRNQQLDVAEVLLKRALELAPQDPYILDSFAWLKYRQGDLTQAEEVLRRCLSMRRDPEIEIHLAEVLWAQDKQKEAQSLLLTARQKDPENELLQSTLKRLGITLP